MDDSVTAQIVLLILCLIGSAIFSSVETALLTANKTKMKLRADAGDKKAAKVLKLCENPDRTISAILIGNNIVNLFAASLATTIAIRRWGDKSAAIATGILTLVVLVFGEVTPKTISTRYADEISRTMAGFVDLVATVLTPVIWFVNLCAGGVMKLIGVDPDKKETMTEEELISIVEASSEDGVIEEDEREIITNVVDFGDSVVKDVMTPRVDMTMIDENANYEELLEVFREDRYTRIPVYRESPDTVVGIVNMKDILLADRSKPFRVGDYMRKPLYTYESKKNTELMAQMRKAYENIAIVLDEYGTTAGMVTMEDLLEEIVGEIRDEYDKDETENIIRLRDGEYLVDGNTKPEELNERFRLGLNEEEYESVSGVMMALLDRVPKVGDQVETDDWRMVVEAMDKMRVEKLHLYIPGKI